MHGIGCHAAHTEGGAEKVGAGTEMLNGAQKFHAVALLLQGIVGRGLALHLDGGGFDLQRLLGLGRQHHGAAHDQGGAHILRGDLLVVIQLLGAHDHLQIFEAGAVVELNEAKGFHVADGACPAANGDFLAAQRFLIGKDRCDFHSFHIDSPFLCKISHNGHIID